MPPRIKIIAVVGLLLTFLAVIWPSGQQDDVAPALSLKTPTGSPTGKVAAMTVAFRDEWPTASFTEIMRQNPFDSVKPPELPQIVEPTPPSPPAPVPPPKVEEPSPPADALKPVPPPTPDIPVAPKRTLKDALQGRTLTAVVKTPAGYTALLGDVVVREGDIIDNGVKVIQIRPDGIELQWADEENPDASSAGK